MNDEENEREIAYNRILDLKKSGKLNEPIKPRKDSAKDMVTFHLFMMMNSAEICGHDLEEFTAILDDTRFLYKKRMQKNYEDYLK